MARARGGNSIWGIARQTFIQCLRLRLALAFVVGLLLFLAVLPTISEGDGTVAGRARTILAYGVSGVGVGLTLLMIFAGVAVVSFDVRDRQIFFVVTKPVSRLEYLLGRWLGVAVLGLLLLAIAGGTLYGVAQAVRGTETTLADRRALETEVFVAREVQAPDAEAFEAKLEAAVTKRLDALRSDRAGWAQTVEQMQTKHNVSPEEAVERIAEQIRQETRQQLQAVAPGQTITWKFTGLDVAAREHSGTGRVDAVAADRRYVRLTGPADLLARLMRTGPVEVAGVEGRIASLESEKATVEFAPEDADRRTISALQKGDEVPVTVPAMIQIKYTPTPIASRAGTLASQVAVRNPETGFVQVRAGSDPIDMPTVLPVLARAVSDAGELELAYRNLSGRTVSLPMEDVAVLYRVGSFEGNFARAIAMMSLQVVYVAALAVFAGSLVSFPVACLLCFAFLPFGLARSYLTEAVEHLLRAGEGFEAVVAVVSSVVLRVMKIVLPNLEATSPSDTLVSGELIGLGALGSAVLEVLLIQTLVILALAWLLFRRREIARVQV